MNDSNPNYSEPFSLLSEAVEQFIQEVSKQKLKNLATDKWTVKGVLCHIVFWHQYYAQQYASLAAGRKPFVFTSKGGSTRNQEGVDALSHLSKNELIEVLNSAQATLYRSIVIDRVPEMDYTDRKRYKTKDFLDVVTRHIKRHTLQVRKAKEVPDNAF